ncbi:MAG: M15 family metallopeptidase, partial [Bacteroidota bacterium]
MLPVRSALSCLLLLTLLGTCDRAPKSPPVVNAGFPAQEPPPPPPPPAQILDYDTTQWLEMTDLDPTIRLDLRYATANNFMDMVIYDCGRCFYRPQVARALLRVHQDLKARNLGLKMYDCYRPAPYQQRLWDVLPDARYVANPKRGSLHSRGAAADLTVVHLDTGEELDMGADFDHFGVEAYTTTTNLPAEVLANRKLFQDAMRKHGFLTIRTEWWHFNYAGPRLPLADWVWECD